MLSPLSFRSPFVAARALRQAATAGLIVLTCGGLLAARTASADAKSAMPAAVGTYKTTKAGVVLYTPGTLENHIDGEAEAVKRYDFKQCAYAEYAPNGQGNQLITADIFQMGSPTDAYGFYTSQRNATATIVKVGAEGYQEPTALNFWKGPYYVRIAITASNPAPFQAAMPQIAQAIAAKLDGPTAVPAIVALLPPGYAPRTEQYRHSDIAAQSYIHNGMVARYPAAGSQSELFVAVFASPAEAKSAYDKYQTYLSAPNNLAVGAKATHLEGIGEKAIGVKTKFTGEVVAAVKGKYLFGVRKATTQAAAQTLVKAAVAHAK